MLEDSPRAHNLAALRTRAQAYWGKGEEWNSLLGAMAP
jgi:hypothetical protein